MKLSDQQIDATMKAYAKKWLKSLDRPRISTTLGYFFTSLFILIWSSSLMHIFGFTVETLLGSLVFIGILILLIFLVWLLVHIMANLGINRPTRSAILLSAVIGPYVFMAIYMRWNSTVISHISGFMTSIFAFILSIFLDKTLTKNNDRDEGSGVR
jgi:hypothetical protein